MYCSRCGRKNMDGALFCEGCGTRLTAPVGVSAAAGSSYATTAMPGYSVPKGCVGQAWSDITGSPHWVKRVLMLMVMNCVPVLNFFSSGYGLQWGAQAAHGEAKPLAAGAFTSKTFVFGLIVALLSILLGLGTSIFSVVSTVPFIGFAVAIVVDLFAAAFYFLAAVRTGVTGKLRSAFDLSELFKAYRKNLGSLFAAAVVPRLIAGVILTVVAIVALFLVGLSDYSYALYDLDNLSYSMRYYGYSNIDMLLCALSGLFAFVVFLVVFYQFIDGFASLWSMRAVGHWIARNEPQWAGEGREAQAPQELKPASVASLAPEAVAPVAQAVPAAQVVDFPANTEVAEVSDPAAPASVEAATGAPGAFDVLSTGAVQNANNDAS